MLSLDSFHVRNNFECRELLDQLAQKFNFNFIFSHKNVNISI